MPKILIVDDSALARKLLRRVLENLSCEVVAEAESGEQAIILYKKHMPDIVTMDIVMKGTDGLQASKIIKKVNPDAKIIIVSSHTQNDLKTELVNNGLNYLILKPVDKKKMSDALNKIMAGQESNINMDDTAEKKLRKEFQSYLTNIGKGFQNKDLIEKDDLAINSKISVIHYSDDQPFAGTVIEKKFDELTLRLEREIEGYSFLVGDPVTICFVSNSIYKIGEASIIEDIPKEKKIKIRVSKINLLNDKELDESFPMSLSIGFKRDYQNKTSSAIIKNIGPYKIRIISKAELNMNDKINFDIFLKERIISINAEVISKTQEFGNYEHELQTTFIDLNSKKFLILFIQKLRDNHEKYITRLISG